MLWLTSSLIPGTLGIGIERHALSTIQVIYPTIRSLQGLYKSARPKDQAFQPNGKTVCARYHPIRRLGPSTRDPDRLNYFWKCCATRPKRWNRPRWIQTRRCSQILCLICLRRPTHSDRDRKARNDDLALSAGLWVPWRIDPQLYRESSFCP